MGNIITFSQQKGGSGKTTLLAHLAIEWLKAGRTVALVDLDPQKSLTAWANMRDDDALPLIESRDYRAGSDIRAAARSSDIVLVDCPGAASGLLDNVVRESDIVIAPCQPSAMDIWASRTIVDTAAECKTLCRIVFNRTPPRQSAPEEILQALGDAADIVMEQKIGNRVAFSRSMMRGQCAQELSAQSLASKEISALREEISSLLPA